MCLTTYREAKIKEKIGYKVMFITRYGLQPPYYDSLHAKPFKVGEWHTANNAEFFGVGYTPGFHAYSRLRDAVRVIEYKWNQVEFCVVKVKIADVHTVGTESAGFICGIEVPAFVGNRQKILKTYQPKEIARYME